MSKKEETHYKKSSTAGIDFVEGTIQVNQARSLCHGLHYVCVGVGNGEKRRRRSPPTKSITI